MCPFVDPRGYRLHDRLRSNECLRAQTEELLGVETKLFAPADYNGVIEGLLGGNLDMAWLGASGIPFAIIFTKSDKLKPKAIALSIERYREQLLQSWESMPPYFVTSATKRTGRERILGRTE